MTVTLYIIYWLLMYLGPFVAFEAGVLISIKLRLHGNVHNTALLIMSIPVCLVTIGNALLISKLPAEGGASPFFGHYGYMQSFGTWLLFHGSLMMGGTGVPLAFRTLEIRFRNGR